MDVMKIENLKELIIEIRGQSILLDSDVAVKNNPDKFPDGYIMELDKNEWDSLKSKFSTSMVFRNGIDKYNIIMENRIK